MGLNTNAVQPVEESKPIEESIPETIVMEETTDIMLDNVVSE